MMLKTATTTVKTESKSESVKPMIARLVQRSQQALVNMNGFSQKQVDQICEAIALAALDHHMELAKMAVAETHRGVVEDKAIKNIYASEFVWNSIRHDKTVGIIRDDDEEQIMQIAGPLGIIAGVTPVTNPTSTVIFKTLLALKGRNTIIFGFHPQAQKACVRTAEIIQAAAINAGAPANCIQWISQPSIEATNALMHHPDIATILATGGPSMVKAAYSSGNPALGVGSGNGPAYIEKTADIKQAVNDIVLSKTFDNGMVCAAENSVIVDDAIYGAVKKEFNDWHCYFVKEAEQVTLAAAMFDAKRGGVKGPIAGKSAYAIAQLADITVPKDTKVLIAEIDGIGPNYPLSQEKLSPVLSLYKAADHAQAFKQAKALLKFGGLGHTAAIHTRDDQLVSAFGTQMLACRILVNSPSALGGIGNLYNNMTPSLTLGTGSYGKNSVSHNVTDKDLINIKTIAKRRNNIQWVKLPPKVYFERNSLRYLAHMHDINRVFLVCDPGMVKLGYVDRVLDVLHQRPNHIEIAIFSEVEADPATTTVDAGVTRMRAFNPDAIIALGGGSALDAAKFMWLLYEHPETSFFAAKQKFLDIRKRVYRLPIPNKAKYIGIPTTSGTGSEVTPYVVITDAETQIKYPITDYAMQPDVAIVDSQFVETLPPRTVAWTGLDTITHATEAYVSVMSSDYTRGWALQALKLAFDNLKASYEGNRQARQKMHDAATMAGMAFASSYLGVNHAIAHKLGGEFHLAHGLAIAITYPQVVRYNATLPTKIAIWPKYSHYTALADYATIARYLGLKGDNDEALKEALVARFIELAHSVGVKLSLQANGVAHKHFEKVVGHLAELAYEDQCTPTNPREPLISELETIMRREWDGQGVEK